MKPWLIVLDPVEKLDKHIDTSLFIAECALKRRVPIYLATEFDLSIENSVVMVRASRGLEFGVGMTTRLEAPVKKKLTDFDVILIRKDPPFDASYVRLCWLVGTAESKSRIYNSPQLLLRYHEKMLPMEGLSQGFLKASDVTTTYLNAPTETLSAFSGQENCILKPFLGHGGRGVEKHKVSELNAKALSSDTLAQPYLKEIEKLGDFRVIFIDGKVAGFFSRFPKEGHYLSNVAQGGTPKIVTMSAAQKKAMERVGKFLKKLKVFLAGVDLIGTKVSEINITSPSGVRIYQNLSGINLADKMVLRLLKK